MNPQELTRLYGTVRWAVAHSAPGLRIHDYGEFGCCLDLRGIDPRFSLLAAVQQGQHDVVVHLPFLAREPGHADSWPARLRDCWDGATRVRFTEARHAVIQDLVHVLADLDPQLRTAIQQPRLHRHHSWD
ncbi:hypothetical protein [Phycicoccus avicenniae]|uniref:hypothetical protein n=1 Tax=Phycicoccus avicenniae TaxID=2828860 RepID=UPI003D2D2F65